MGRLKVNTREGDLSDVGYDFLCENKPNSRRNKKLLVEQIRKLRKIGDLPPVYPNGWFALAESPDIKVSQVKYVAALGEHFAIFRTKDGDINVLDAYCPHLGANMAIGGIVHGNCLECPFHGWKFSGDDGKCVDIPYTSSKVPPSAKVRKWLSKEVNNFIFIWYHAENEEPAWHIQHIPEIQSGKWWYRGRNEFIINSHIQEIPENGADVAHLNAIHAPSLLGGYDIRNYNKKWLGFCKHRWSAKWAACQEPDSRHIGVMKLLHEMYLFNKFTVITMDVTATQIGPSYVELLIKTTFGPMMVLQTVTPIEPMLQRVIHRVYSPPLLSPYATLLLYGETVMVARDVMVWNHKEYIRRPLLVKEDQTIQLHRRWYNQFYSENSPKFSFQKDNMEW
ncbi:cholesterol 7-desaturase nvd [Lycorma delicatula]|uniref:cholesterol 7-desaturase nvd n=1 Tax=Lycorma delicatula TaxID=130591 RepID=UPI003F519AF0